MKSILAGYNAQNAAELERLGDDLAGIPGVIEANITETHRKAVEILTKLMTMGQEFSTDETPVPLRVLMRTLSSLKPMLLEMLAKVPPQVITQFMLGLRADIDEIIQTAPLEPPAVPSAHDNDAAAADPDAAAGPSADLAAGHEG